MMRLNKFKIFIFILIGLIVIYAIWLFFGPVKTIYAAGKRMPEIIQGIETEISKNDYISANIYIKQAKDNIAVIQNNLKFVKFVKILPIFGDGFKKIEQMLSDAESICINSSKIIKSIVGLGDVDKDDILLNLSKYPEEIEDLEKSLSSLMNNTKLITGILKINNSKIVKNISFITKFLKIIQPINEYVFEMIGYNGEKRYLLLFQNNTELRPTGGFIGTYGLLTILNGKITDLFIDDIYHLDSKVIGELKNEVPEPLKKYLKVNEWYMRDCNWQPDFPSTAKDCLNLYKLESEDQQEINGIIALTPDAIGELFDIIGAQMVSGVLFESNNFTNDLQKAVELYYRERGSTHWDRKNIIQSLANVIIDRFQYLNISDYEKVLDLIINSLKTKDILLYSNNHELQSILSDINWNGEIKQIKYDYLMVVDSNLASFKTDQFIDRTVYYNLEQNENNELIAIVTIDYKHNGDFSWNSTRYKTYTRILVPQKSELLEVIDLMENNRTDKTVDKFILYDKTIFGTFISIEPQETKSLVFKYKLPDYIKNQINKREYKIYFQKQPGVKNVQYILDVKFNEDFSHYGVNLDDIIQDNLSGFKAKFELNNDYSAHIHW